MITLLGLVLPLGLDTFAVSLGLGASNMAASKRLRLALLFATFEAGMPLVGLLLGNVLAGTIGGTAVIVAALVLLGVGAYMIYEAVHENEEDETSRILSAHGWQYLLVALSISLDELAIGFTLGLSSVPVAAAIALIGLQAFGVSLLGLALGRRLGEALGERAELLAGVILCLMGLLFLGDHFFGLGIL